MKLFDYKKISWSAMLIVMLLSFGFLFTEENGGDKLKHPVYTKMFSDPQDIFMPAISPNGKFIVYPKVETNEQNNLFIIPSDGSKPPVRITSGNYIDMRPKWSPIGDKILFESQRGGVSSTDIYSLEVSQESGVAAGEIKRITISGGMYGEWSPDAKQILFINYEKDFSTMSFNLIPSNGGLSKTIYSMGRLLPMYLKFSPDGKYIYFCKRTGWQETSINRISSSGGEAELLYEKKTIIDISPNGDFLVMGDNDSKNPDREKYFLIGSSSGKGVTQKFPVLKKMRITSWGNDENSLIATSAEYTSSLRVINSYGGKYRELTDGRGWDYPPAWSPDGKSIAYMTQLNGSTALMLIPASGGAARQIPTKNILNRFSMLRWAPSGKMLAIEPDSKKGILIVDLELNKEYLLLPQAVINFSFVWSNDSKSLYYNLRKNSKNYINRVELDGKVTAIVSSKSSQKFVNLSQPVDQDKIYILRYTDDSSILFSISLRSKQEKEILRFKGNVFEVSISPDGKLAAFSLFPIIKSSESTEDIYLMSFDEAKPVKIATTKNLYLIKWNNDGSRIFFIDQDESWNAHVGSISITDRQKTNLTESDPSSIWEYDLSPDASQIVYCAEAAKNSSVWRLDISEIMKDYKNKLKK